MAVALFIANPHMRGWNWLEAAITVAVAAALALMLDVAAIRLASFQKRRSTDRLLLTRPLITRNATLLVIVAVLIELFALG